MQDVELEPARRTFPDLVDFSDAADIQGWTGSSVAVTQCGVLGNLLGGYNVLASGNFVEKVWRSLPEHQGVTINFLFVFGDTCKFFFFE